MILSAQEIAHSREHALNNLLDLSSACIEAGQRLSTIYTHAGRDAIHHGGRQWSQFGHGQLDALTQLPASLWLEHAGRVGHLLEQTLDIVGETHKAMIRTAEAQIRAFDELTFASINRAAKSSPWEGEVALNALRTTLQGAEQTLHGMSEAAIDSVTLAEQELHQVTQVLSEEKPAPRRRRTSTA